MGKGLFEELLYLDKDDESILLKDEDLEESDDKSTQVEESANIPLVGSPVYPRIFWGDSAKPLINQFPNSEYVDDNIHRTYEGLLSYFG